jgi:hypothetical protein
LFSRHAVRPLFYAIRPLCTSGNRDLPDASLEELRGFMNDNKNCNMNIDLAHQESAKIFYKQ